MIRTCLLVVLFALCAAAVTVPGSYALAGNEGGLFGFFNRSRTADDDTGGAAGAPVHMKPNVSGTAASPGAKPFNFGRSRANARTEDLIDEERRRTQQAFDSWNANEVAKANASTAQLMEQFFTQLQYNEQQARQDQAQKIAQGGKGKTAGPAPGRPDPALLQSMRNTALQQSLQSFSASGLTAPAPVTEPEAQAEPAPEKPKREFKPRHFFNRTE